MSKSIGYSLCKEIGEKAQIFIKDFILGEYEKKKPLSPPVNIDIIKALICEYKGIKILDNEPLESESVYEGRLIPIEGGFKILLNQNEKFLYIRKKFTLCHELAHIFFYDCNHRVPRKIITPPEDICYKIARQILIPDKLVEKHFNELYNNKLFLFSKKLDFPLLKKIKELARIYEVSLEAMVDKLMLDKSLFKKEVITFWEFNEKKQCPSISFKNFDKRTKISSHLKTCSEVSLSSYKFREYIYPKIWRDLVENTITTGKAESKEITIIFKREKKELKIHAETIPLTPKRVQQTRFYNVASFISFL